LPDGKPGGILRSPKVPSESLEPRRGASGSPNWIRRRIQ